MERHDAFSGHNEPAVEIAGRQTVVEDGRFLFVDNFHNLLDAGGQRVVEQGDTPVTAAGFRVTRGRSLSFQQQVDKSSGPSALGHQ